MNINANVLCEACKKCNEFEIEEEILSVFGDSKSRMYSCKYVQLCINAVNIWEQMENKASKTADRDKEYENLIKIIGSATYGKERWFLQDNDIWYDRKDGAYITQKEMEERIYKELDEL